MKFLVIVIMISAAFTYGQWQEIALFDYVQDMINYKTMSFALEHGDIAASK